MRARTGLAAALAAVVLAGCGAAPRHAAQATIAAQPVDSAARIAPLLKTANFGAAAALAQARQALLRAELARLRRSPAVAAALQAAWLAGRVSAREAARMQSDWTRAQRTLPRLSGTRAIELGSVVATVRDLAARHALTPDRVPAVLLGLRRNLRFWTHAAALPAAGFRTTFGADPVVFQYYPGRGLQLQPLASWGRVNARARVCLGGGRCRKGALRRALDRLSGLAARRAGYVAWEYYFDYAGGTPPWVSGMTQATAVQALARGYRLMRAARWRRTALRALGAFELPPPAGVAVPAPGGTDYLMYSFAPGYLILNGDLQAVTGLDDAARLARSRRAAALFRRGERAARRAVAAYDTGAWSLYSDAGDESTLPYHELLAGFLQNLCKRTHEPVYCRTAARFVHYEREPPRIGIAALPTLRPHRTAVVRFSLSKVSSVTVRVWGAHGVSLARRLRLPHGGHAVDWTPPAGGRFRLWIAARGPSGPVGVARRTLRVRRAHPRTPARKVAPRRRNARQRGNLRSVHTLPAAS
jgi:D-glucuronyl C5-epimerase C-terminus